MFSVKSMILVVLYLLIFIFGFMGIFKRARLRKSANGNRLLYLSEQLSYSQILLKNYPEKFFLIEKMTSLFQLVKILIYIGLGSVLTIIYLMFKTFNYLNVRPVGTLLIILYVIYLLMQRRLFQLKKATMELVLTQTDNLDKVVLTKIINHSKEIVDSYIFTFVAILIAYLIIIFL